MAKMLPELKYWGGLCLDGDGVSGPILEKIL